MTVSMLFASFTVSAASSGVKVNTHTPDEIRSYVQNISYSSGGRFAYSTEPDVSSFRPGVLSDSTLQDGLQATNMIRYIAGLDAVKLDSSLSEKCAAAALCNAANNVLSHQPTQPAGMPDSLYELAYAGASSSNLAWGYYSLPSLVYGFMDDSDGSNIDRVGHRRWILNPALGSVGFGACSSFSGMAVFDRSNRSASQDGVCWPAQEMPTELFDLQGTAWSYSTSKTTSTPSAVTVKLTRLRDGTVWNFSSSSSDGYFNINQQGYGQSCCVIFRPTISETAQDGDTYQVEISGLTVPVSYQVHFFSLEKQEPESQVQSGDLNGDSTINSKDATIILIAAAKLGVGGTTGLTQQQLVAGDVNSDGVINAKDATIVLKYSAAYGVGKSITIADFC